MVISWASFSHFGVAKMSGEGGGLIEDGAFQVVPLSEWSGKTWPYVIWRTGIHSGFTQLENGGSFHSCSIQYHIWLVASTYPSEKHEFVSWDCIIPNICEKKKRFQTTNQHNYIWHTNKQN